MDFNSCYKNKTVIVTGHTGFKGSWLVRWLKDLGANIIGISLDPVSELNHFNLLNISSEIEDLRIDIRNPNELKNIFLYYKPDFVFHLAAQALVSKSYISPYDTWSTNVIGTLNVLDALRNLNNDCVALMITSDKCYENVEWHWGYRENDSLGGIDPYSASKACTELTIRSYVKSFFPKSNTKVRIASVRAGNVIGGGDWSEDRIVPDCVKAWSEDKAVFLRKPHATRPWQHVLEPLSGYLTLGQILLDDIDLHGEAFNFGPQSQQNKSVLELVTEMAKYWEKVKWEDISGDLKGPYESGLLKLNCDKALNILKWQAVLDFQQTVKLTTQWYTEYYNSPSNISALTINQINVYRNFAIDKKLPWVYQN
jgi:CDP-glucose 4,6-dehydratase